jgi:hypothetical protein
VIAVDGKRVTIGVGAAQGVTTAWSATLLVGDSDAPLPDGDVRIVQVVRNVTIGDVKVDADTLRANSRVRLQRKLAAPHAE